MGDRLPGTLRAVADVGLGVVVAAALVVQAAAVAASWGGGYWLSGCLAGVVVCAIALVRRRLRTWGTVAGLAVAAVAIIVARAAELPSEPGPAVALGLSVLVGSSIRALPALPAAAIAAGGFAVVAGTWLADPPPTSGVAGVTALNGAGWTAALAVGLGLRLLDARRRAVADSVRRDERMRLARELHDVAAHHLTGIILQAQAAQLVTRRQPGYLDGPLADVQTALAGIEAAGSDGLTAMRRVVGLLRDAEDADPTTSEPEQLSVLVERFEQQGPAVRLRVPDGRTAWPPEVAGTVYRVVQESLTNIARHAPEARSVTVDVDEDHQGVTVAVTDDGPTASHRHHGGYGLIGMRERVEALGGTLCAGPRPGAGWAVRATLPVPARVRR
ncbi:sensor histidine kinase [Pseudonocardia xinjiangensis]|uniref:sensor histidine kinase n=1 Tax=Pseudonocardia xinjiangensis TaxID=75289 RepID=UPI003D8D1454